MYQIKLPWPPAKLSPNARVHWADKARAAKAYREECGWLFRQTFPLLTGAPTYCPAQALLVDGRLPMWIDFYPPDRRRRDDDNCLAMFKSGRDGLADAMAIDDRVFISRPCVMDETGGYVIVRFGNE